MIRFVAACVLLTVFALPSRAVEFIWGITGAHSSGSTLYQINPSTGAVLGQAGPTGAVALAGIAIHPTSGVLYAANGAAAPTGLYTLNKATGAASLLGSSGKVVPCMSFDAAGALYGWDQVGKKLMMLNVATGAPTVLNGDVNASGTGLAFAPTGILYLKSNNSLYVLNKVTGLKIGNAVALAPGGAVTLDNLLVFNPAGTLYTGVRTPSASATGTTDIYVADPTTGLTTLSMRVPLALTGFVFDNAPPPILAVTGKKKFKTKKALVTLKGTANSLLPLTVSAKKINPVGVTNGNWVLKAKLKKGKNVVNLACVDGFGQSAAAKVTIIRN